MTNRYDKAGKASKRNKEHNDCAVIALSIACRVPYNKAHKALESAGRKHGHMTSFNLTRSAVRLLGCELTEVTNRNDKPLRQKTGSKYTPKTIGSRLKSGYYIVRVNAHIFAVVNGQVEDWTKGRNHHIKVAYRVTVPKGSRS